VVDIQVSVTYFHLVQCSDRTIFSADHIGDGGSAHSNSAILIIL